MELAFALFATATGRRRKTGVHLRGIRRSKLNIEARPGLKSVMADTMMHNKVSRP